jgi:hypothetical protein
MNNSQDVLMHMHASNEERDVTMSHDDADLPQMDPASEGEDSSFGSSTSSCHQPKDCSKANTCNKHHDLSKKRVRWDTIQTREYALVVGDHPLCQDGLPVSLDWKYSDYSNCLIKSFKLSERKQSYVFPRRLSYEERRQRLCAVSGLSDEQVKNDEIDLVVRTLKESWEQVTVETSEMDPLSDMMIWEDVIGTDLDIDLGDISDFEWTD